MTEQKDTGSAWLTTNQFMSLGITCCMCEDIAVWISKIKGHPAHPAYCDRHYPFGDKEPKQHEKD